jgi:hypothetical protein
MATTATVLIVPRMTETLETTARKKMTPETVRRAIAERGLLQEAEKRGFAPGREEEDWLEAEQEVKQLSEYWLP